jgi:hypothetical protein
MREGVPPARVPEHKMEDLKEAVRSEAEGIWSDISWMIFEKILGASLTLGLGFVIHMLS